MILLSQLHAVDPTFLSNAVLVLFGICGFVVALLTIWNNVRMRPPHETPTRREFDDLKTKVGHIEQSLAPMERRILDGVAAIGVDLTQKIGRLGEHEYTARGELWEKLNRTAERVATQEGASDLAAGIAKAITATTASTKKS